MIGRVLGHWVDVRKVVDIAYIMAIESQWEGWIAASGMSVLAMGFQLWLSHLTPFG